MSINYNNTNNTNEETQDERYIRILRKWFELNSPNGVEDMNQLTDRERRVWTEEIQYLTRALVELCKYINPEQIDKVIPIILRGYYGGFIPHNVRKVYNVCKENERRIRDVIGYYLRFRDYSESRAINRRLNSRQEHRFNHYRGYRSDDNTIDNSSYTAVDQISVHKFNKNTSNNSNLGSVNSDKMLDDYMNQKQSSNTNDFKLSRTGLVETDFKNMLDNCFRETEYIKPETETLVFNEATLNQPFVNQPISAVPQTQLVSQPFQQEPTQQTQIQKQTIPNMELEEGEIDLNVPEINNLNEINVNPVSSTLNSYQVTLINSNQVTPINSNQVSSTVNPLIQSFNSCLKQSVVPQSLQNVRNTVNTEIDNLNKVRDEINAYIDEVIAKLKESQPSN